MAPRKRQARWAALVCVVCAACGASRARTPAPTPGSEPGTSLMSPQDRAQLAAIAAARTTGPGVGYVIGPDDLLEIRIPDLYQPEGALRPTGEGAALPAVAPAPLFQQGIRVGADGQVNVPLLGPVPARGLPPAALEQEIARRLVARGILRAPQVSVTVAEYRSGVVAVIGSVERPGLYPVTRPGATLADMIWTAGGPNRDAGRVVEFVPAVPGVTAAAPAPGSDPIRLDLQALLKPGSAAERLPTTPVRPGDVISLSPAGTVQVDGWVEKPGSYPVTRGLTLSGAVAAAGGALFAADLNHATLKRGSGSGEQNLVVDLKAVHEGRTADVAVTDGDVVRLDASTARVVPWGVWTVTRELVRIGGNVLLF